MDIYIVYKKEYRTKETTVDSIFSHEVEAVAYYDKQCSIGKHCTLDQFFLFKGLAVIGESYYEKV